MRRLVDWIKRHQVASFIIITFGFSWFFFGLNLILFSGSIPAQALCGKIAVFDPALAGRSDQHIWCFRVLPAWIVSASRSLIPGIRTQF